MMQKGVFTLWRTQPWGERAIAYEKRRWAERADAMVVCIDPRNGRTLWRKVFPRAAANAQNHKGAGNNPTPDAADRGGVRPLVARKTKRLLQFVPARLGPALRDGHLTNAGQQTQEHPCQ
jgi:hypothetical protein